MPSVSTSGFGGGHHIQHICKIHDGEQGGHDCRPVAGYLIGHLGNILNDSVDAQQYRNADEKLAKLTCVS